MTSWQQAWNAKLSQDLSGHETIKRLVMQQLIRIFIEERVDGLRKISKRKLIAGNAQLTPCFVEAGIECGNWESIVDHLNLVRP